jgi:hypothetical protein
MGVTNGTIRRPVSISDVQSVLGSSSGDLATLCLMNNINMWSGMKPVYMTIKSVLTDAQWKTGRTLSGYSISYGIKKRALTAISDYVDSSGNVKNEVWSYDKPVKDNTNVFRLSDFENYKHNSINPMVITLPTNSTMYVTSGSQQGTQLNFQINFPFNRVTQTDYENGNIGSEQLFGGLESYYPSVLMTFGVSSTPHQYCKSASIPIGEIGRSSAQSGVTITIYGSDLYEAMKSDGTLNAVAENAKWTACLVLTSRRLDGANTPIANHAAFGYNNTIVVRLEHTAAVNNVWVDRKVLTIVPIKKSYISSMKARFTFESSQYGIKLASITLIANVEQSDANLSFSAQATVSIIQGNIRVNGYADVASARTVNDFSTSNANFSNTTGVGVTRSLGFRSTEYQVTGVDPAAHEPILGLSITFVNTHGNWTASYSKLLTSEGLAAIEVNCN